MEKKRIRRWMIHAIESSSPASVFLILAGGLIPLGVYLLSSRAEYLVWLLFFAIVAFHQYQLVQVRQILA